MRLLHSLIALLFLGSPAYAISEVELLASCPTKEAMQPFIMMCGHNLIVAQHAQNCRDAVVESWQGATKRLLPILQSRGKTGNQNVSEDETRRSYQDAILELIAQIQLMQRYTAVIADYPQVMIDLGGSTGDDTSLSCFNDAFHQVQAIVTFLDAEIVRAKKIRQSAMQLRDLAGSRHQTLENSVVDHKITRGVSSSAPAKKGKSPSKASKITGKIRDRVDFDDMGKPKP